MKRGTKCVAQTINLSNPETCIRPKRIQKLVKAEVMQPCPSVVSGGTAYWTPRPVPIKICTRRDMERTCPPKVDSLTRETFGVKRRGCVLELDSSLLDIDVPLPRMSVLSGTCTGLLCDCPQKAPPRTMGQRLCRALIFLLKSSIAAGLVYWTHAEGLWGSSTDVEDLYRRIMITISPGDEVELPRIYQYKYTLIQKYNHAVFAVMNYILSASTMLRTRIQRLMVEEKSEEVSEEDTEKDEES